MKTKTNQWIAVDTEVTWESQASGYSKAKTGVVRAHLPNTISRTEADKLSKTFTESKFSALHLMGFPSGPHRYLVEVIRLGKQGQRLKSKWYTPRKATVDKFNPPT